MTEFRVKTAWLSEAWGGACKQEIEPVISVEGTTLKVTIFPNGGAGMRVQTQTIEETGATTFKITQSIRSFVKLIDDFDSIRIAINGDDMTITGERPNSAMQCHFQKIEMVEDNYIEEDSKDILINVPTHEWLSIWKSVPEEGTIAIRVDRTMKSLTLKHSLGWWGAAVQATEKPSSTQTFTADAMVAKRIFQYSNAESTFSTLTFMCCGVLKWKQGRTIIYIAPSL